LENRQLFSYASTILSDVYAHGGDTWTYQYVNSASTVAGSETFLAKGNTTFDGHDVFQLQTGFSATTSTVSETSTINDYFTTTGGGLIDYGNTTGTSVVSSASTNTTSSQTTFTPNEVLLPATLTPGVPDVQSWTRTMVTTISTGVTSTTNTTTESDSDTFVLASDSTQSLTVPAGTYNVYEVDVTHEVTVTGESPTTDQEEVFVSQGTGLIKDVSGPLGSPTGTIELTNFSPAGNGGGGGGGGGGSTGTTTPTSSLTPTLSGTLPTSVIAGAKTKIAETVTITNTGSAYDNTATGSLFLSTGTTITSSSIQLPETITKTLKLKAGAHYAAKFSIKSLPASVPNGTYYLIADVTDSSGNTATTASSGTITVAPPEVDLSAAFSKFSSTAVAGKKLKETIVVSNTAGNEAATGILPIEIETSPDGLLSDATVVTPTSKKINLKQGASISIPLTLTASAALNDDFLIVDIDPSNTLHSTSTTGELVVSATKLAVS
jgi:hypothetical protein